MANGHVLKESDLAPSASDVFNGGPSSIPHCLPQFATDGIFVSTNSWYMDFCAATGSQSWFQVNMGTVRPRSPPQKCVIQKLVFLTDLHCDWSVHSQA